MKSIIALTFVAVSLGCGSSSTAIPDASKVDAMPMPMPDAQVAMPAATGTIDVNVTYAGTKKGELIAVALKTFPPTTPPNGIGRTAIPIFPQKVTIKDLDPGMYTVLAVIDVLPASPTRPGTEDASSPPKMAVQVVAGQATKIDIVIP
jgi:hypothetical protein